MYIVPANNGNLHSIRKQSEMSVCLTKVTFNMITTLSVIIPCCSYFQFSVVTVFFFAVVLGELSRLCISCLGTFILLLQKTLNYLALQSFDQDHTWWMSPVEGYSRNVSCALNLISTFYSPSFVFVLCFVCPVLPVVLDCLFL